MSRLVPPGCPLSQRQYECMTLLAEGLTQRQVGAVLGICRDTVKNHVLQAQWVLGAHNQQASIALFVKAGWFDPPSRGVRDYSNMRPAA